MTLLEADQFYTAKLCGLFTKWAPTQAQYEFWVNRLQGIDKSEAEQALEVYVEVKTKTEDEPTWARFAEHLSKVIKNLLEMMVLTQRYGLLHSVTHINYPCASGK